MRWLAVALFVAIQATVAAPDEPAAGADSPQESVRVALMRGIPEKWALEQNFAVFLKNLAEADAQGATLFITPECWLDGYAAADPESTRERLIAVAQEIDGSNYLAQVANEARTRGMFICLGFSSMEGGRLYNTAGLWDTGGALIGLYHKTHLQTHDLQYDYGEALPVWQTPWGAMGVMICADRRWPETARTLRLQGARLILNPTYGFHGEMNTAIMRTRAYENQCFIAFAHPEESLVTAPGGDVVAQEKSDTGVLVCDIALTQATTDGHLADRRPELYGVLSQGGSAATALPDRDGQVLRVAAAQMLSSFDVAANTKRIMAFLEEAHTKSARVVVFPEMALAGYTKEALLLARLDWAAIDAGVEEIRAACDRLDVYAVVGAPTRDDDGVYCAAVTIDPDGSIIDSYEKIYLAGEAWAKPGRRLSTFSIDGAQSATFICHDERYGPLVQLRALAGAQLFFYISCESGVTEMHKRNPYRAQVQARAQENRVFLVHANTPAAANPSGLADVSHGESRIIDPDGIVLAEAPVYGEELVIADLQLARANAGGLKSALSTGPLAEWMRAGVALVERGDGNTTSEDSESSEGDGDE